MMMDQSGRPALPERGGGAAGLSGAWRGGWTQGPVGDLWNWPFSFRRSSTDK